MPIETWAVTAYTIVSTDGGISTPRVPAAQIVPATREGSYLRRSISGMASTPMDVTAAPTTPVMAAMTTQMMTVPMASPPRKRPNQSPMTRYRSSMTPERCRMLAMRM